MHMVKELRMIMHTIHDSVMKFRKYGDGIYYFDASGHKNPKNNILSNYYLISTIADNKTYFKRK